MGSLPARPWEGGSGLACEKVGQRSFKPGVSGDLGRAAARRLRNRRNGFTPRGRPRLASLCAQPPTGDPRSAAPPLGADRGDQSRHRAHRYRLDAPARCRVDRAHRRRSLPDDRGSGAVQPDTRHDAGVIPRVGSVSRTSSSDFPAQVGNDRTGQDGSGQTRMNRPFWPLLSAADRTGQNTRTCPWLAPRALSFCAKDSVGHEERAEGPRKLVDPDAIAGVNQCVTSS